MILKLGVRLALLEPQTALAMMVVESVAIKLTLPELVITSVNDSEHMDGSLHYLGLAFDIRTHSMRKDQIDIFFKAIKDALGDSGFDIILESDHIHIEYDPKPKVMHTS